MRRKEQLKELNLEAWRQARLIAFSAAGPYLPKDTTIFTFMELPGDRAPTSADALAEAEKRALAKIEEYKNNGWLKANA